MNGKQECSVVITREELKEMISEVVKSALEFELGPHHRQQHDFLDNCISIINSTSKNIWHTIVKMVVSLLFTGTIVGVAFLMLHKFKRF